MKEEIKEIIERLNQACAMRSFSPNNHDDLHKLIASYREEWNARRVAEGELSHVLTIARIFEAEINRLKDNPDAVEQDAFVKGVKHVLASDVAAIAAADAVADWGIISDQQCQICGGESESYTRDTIEHEDGCTLAAYLDARKELGDFLPKDEDND
jgi:hypothetical protein